MQKRFAMLGAAGYIAPRHMEAIKHVGGDLVAVCDPHDSVGILDRYFPDCLYFREFERFERYLDIEPQKIDYLVVCSPNYLHDAHAAFGLRIGADVILEKPASVRVHNVDRLIELERSSKGVVWCILQLRHSEIVQQIRERIAPQHHQVSVRYWTPRGEWYLYSWKGDIQKSGWIVTNIGVHLFDLLIYLFGDCKTAVLGGGNSEFAYGTLELKTATVGWDLTTLKSYKPTRTIQVDGLSGIDLSSGFTNLHNLSYERIMAKDGFRLRDARPAIEVSEWLLDQYIAGRDFTWIEERRFA